MKKIFLCLCLVTLSAQAQECPQAAHKAFLASLLPPSGKGAVVALFPFQDGSQASIDPTLGQSFPFLFHLLLRDAGGMTLLHPLVTENAVTVRGLANESLFDDDIIANMGKELKATHAVYGMFQRRPGGFLRVFLKIADLKQNKVLGPVIEYTAEEGNRFFSVGSDAAKALARAVTGKKMPVKTPKVDFESFRFFVKGMEKSKHFSEADLAIARVWFEKSYSLSYSFTESLVQKARTLLMSIWLARLNGKDPAILMAEVHDTLARVPGNPLVPGKWFSSFEKALAKEAPSCVR